MTWVDSVARATDDVTLTEITWQPLEWLTMHMREIDRIEIFNNMPTDNPLEIAAICMKETERTGGYGRLAWLNGVPTAAFGLFEMWRGTWQGWSYGTDEYGRVAAYFLEEFRKGVRHVIDKGCHRIECRSHITHRESHRFLRAIGAEHEATFKCYGKDKADYLLFSWTRERLAYVSHRDGTADDRSAPLAADATGTGRLA